MATFALLILAVWHFVRFVSAMDGANDFDRAEGWAFDITTSFCLTLLAVAGVAFQLVAP